MKLEGKVGIVTGAARGIGRATAIELARNGADVVVNDLLATGEAEAVVREIEALGRRSFFFHGDVADRASDERMIEETVRRLGRLDILVNNAAYSVRKPLLELEVADVERTWAVTLWAALHCSQFAARQMVKQGQGGSIIMISSVHAQRAFALSTAYNAAKAAVNHMALTWAMELAPHRIRVNVIEPGWIDTPGERKFYSEEQLREQGGQLPFGRLGRAEEIARGAAFLAAEEDAGYMTGSILRIDGGILLPYKGE